METRNPRDFRMHPSDAAVIPFPRELTTPPVTKMYLIAMGHLLTGI
jgi:hypothetical protein